MPADTELLEMLKQSLNLRETEADTLLAVITHCAKLGGLPMGGAAAVATSGVGAVMVPGVGAVPGWLIGFVAGFTGGTVMCTVAHRGVVVEALKRILSDINKDIVSDHDAVNLLRAALNR